MTQGANQEIADKAERIAKVIASRGVCSRRDAEKLVISGVVKVDGIEVRDCAYKVSSNAKIEINGVEVRPNSSVIKIWMLNKPKGYICTAKDTHGRRTVFELLPKDMPRVLSIGRLDYNTEGLLLFTNSGALARGMELPSSHLKRVYLCRAGGAGQLTAQDIKALKEGITVDGIRYGSIEVELMKKKGFNNWYRVCLSEGKNREIRKVFAKFNTTVSRLIRTDYGPFKLGELEVGKVREVGKTEVKNIMNALGIL